MALNIKRICAYLQALDFKRLFCEIGWSSPKKIKPLKAVLQNIHYSHLEIAELAGVFVLEIEMQDGKIPDAKMRKLIHTEISSLYEDSLLIFLDPAPYTQSLWHWVKHAPDHTRSYLCEHLYVKGQRGELALG